MNKCRKCELNVDVGAEFCGNCGAAINPVRHAAPSVPQVAHTPPAKGNPIFNGHATGSLVLGIISLPSALIPFFGIPVSVAAFTLGLLGRQSQRRTRAIIGIVLAIIGIGLTLLQFRSLLGHTVINKPGDPGSF